MIYTAIDNLYLTEEQIKTSPSRKDGIDEATEVALRIYGCDCDLIQEGGILLNLRPQAVMATGAGSFPQVLVQRSLLPNLMLRYLPEAFLTASCVWLPSKLEEKPKKAKTGHRCVPQDGVSQGEKYLRELLFVKSSCPCDEGEAATRIKEYMKDNRSKDEIVRILQQQHAIPVYLTMKAWDQIEIESPGFFEEYFVQTLLNPDAEISFLCFFFIWPSTDQGPTQLASTSMGTAGRDTGASSSSLHVPPPTGDALIPVQQALSSGTAQNVPIVTRAQVPPLTDNRASSSSSQVPPETANAPVQQPLSPKTEILMKILATLVEMKSKQDQMLHLMSDGRMRTRDEQDQTQQERPRPQAVMATGQVLFHSCELCLACIKTGREPKKARRVIVVFHRMECRRENFVCHVEHPHKFISNYLATLETPPELRQEAWNLANDRFQVPLPDNPPWWKSFDADKSGIDQVCRVLALLYSLPKAQYISVCKDGKPFTFSTRSGNTQAQSSTKDVLPAVHSVDTKCVQLITSLRME
ncbi:unnamed protein product [Brassica oleracea]